MGAGNTVDWDGAYEWSAVGGGPVVAKESYLTAGESATTGLVKVDFDGLNTIGIRGSNSESGSFSKTFTNDFVLNSPTNDPVIQHIVDFGAGNDHDLSYATFYFDASAGTDNAGLDKVGDIYAKNGKIGEGVLTVKVAFSDAGASLTDYYQGILDALSGQGVDTSLILGVAVHAGNGQTETFYAHVGQVVSATDDLIVVNDFTNMGDIAVANSAKYVALNAELQAATGIDHLVQNSYIDLAYNYGDLVPTV